jgi:hypothetical protein
MVQMPLKGNRVGKHLAMNYWPYWARSMYEYDTMTICCHGTLEVHWNEGYESVCEKGKEGQD